MSTDRTIADQQLEQLPVNQDVAELEAVRRAQVEAIVRVLGSVPGRLLGHRAFTRIR